MVISVPGYPSYKPRFGLPPPVLRGRSRGWVGGARFKNRNVRHLRAAFPTNFDLCFTRFLPHTSRWRLILSTGLCANSRLKTSKAAIASCAEIRSSLETFPPSEVRARIASSAALTRSRSVVRLISKTAARYSCHQLFLIRLDSREKTAHAALLFSEVSSSERAKA